jgi:hypothetical protein
MDPLRQNELIADNDLESKALLIEIGVGLGTMLQTGRSRVVLPMR